MKYISFLATFFLFWAASCSLYAPPNPTQTSSDAVPIAFTQTPDDPPTLIPTKTTPSWIATIAPTDLSGERVTSTSNALVTSIPTIPATVPPTDQVLQIPKTNFPSCEPVLVPFMPVTLPSLPTSVPTLTVLDTIPSLRSLAEENGMLIGAAVEPINLLDLQFAGLLTREFNLVAAENAMKWDRLHPEPGRYDFTEGDTLVTFAQDQNMSVYGHVLVWSLQLPTWVTEGDYTRDEWIHILCTHIKTVVNHYRGQIYAWDVVNEAVDENGLLRNTVWLSAIGPDYIAMAFQWAHEADPNARLVYNDFAWEGMNRKSQGIYALVQGLIQQGVPIHGVGLQMHVLLGGPPTPQELAENMERLVDLGLEVHITEMDVVTYMTDASPEEKLAAQAQVYRQAFAICLNNPSCTVFAVWGATDRYSWIVNFKGLPDAPTLFDQAGLPKPAYYAILDLLQGPQHSIDVGWQD